MTRMPFFRYPSDYSFRDEDELRSALDVWTVGRMVPIVHFSPKKPRHMSHIYQPPTHLQYFSPDP